jgi:hypothetical protein
MPRVHAFMDKEFKSKLFLMEAGQKERDQFYELLHRTEPEEFLQPLFDLMK